MSQLPTFHEDLARSDAVKAGSARTFGVVFAVAFGLIGLWPLLGGTDVRVWALSVSGAFLVLALLWPRALTPLNMLWFRLGMLLHRIVNPAVMMLLFYGTVTPIAVAMRLLGKDSLRLKFDRAAPTYWIERTPPGPAPETMRRQF